MLQFIFYFNKRGCDILNYVVTPSDHQCTNDGDNFIFISQSISSRCVCRDPTMACCNVGIITTYYNSNIIVIPATFFMSFQNIFGGS